MVNHDFITLPSDGSDMEAYIAFPEGNGPFPGMIVFQEAFGVNHHIRSIADRFSNEGYATIAPELFHRKEKHLEIAYTDLASARPFLSSITTENLEADAKAAFEWLQNQSNIIHEKTGSIGFCMGGRVSFIANTILPLAASVSYYGGGLDTMADRASRLHAPHLFFWGGQDKHITPDKVDTIINAVRSAGKEYINTVISYADHGFHCDERASYHPLAAREAWAMTLRFFENRLKAVVH